MQIVYDGFGNIVGCNYTQQELDLMDKNLEVAKEFISAYSNIVISQQKELTERCKIMSNFCKFPNSITS